MSMSLKNRSYNRSGVLGSSINNKSASFAPSASLASTKAKSLRSDVQHSLANSTIDSIELEYIKNLQQQVYFLDLECNYLRQQLNVNGLQSSLKYDTKSAELREAMQSMEQERSTMEREKNTAMEMLELTENSFHEERALLLKEIATLKQQKTEAETDLLNTSVELSKARENLDKHHLSGQQSYKLEAQLDGLRQDNMLLRAEITDARSQLISRDNTIRELHEQLSDPNRKTNVAELRSSMNSLSTKLSQTNEALTKEAITVKQLQDENNRMRRDLDQQKHQNGELVKENKKLSTSFEISLKQNETDLIIAKRNADTSRANLEKLQAELDHQRALNANLRTQIDQFNLQESLELKNQNFLKKRNDELQDSLAKKTAASDAKIASLEEQIKAGQRQLEAEQTKNKTLQEANRNLEVKLNQANDSLDKAQLNHKVLVDATKSKASHLETIIENHLSELNTEKNNNSVLNLKIDTLVRQETIHTNLIASLKVRINELESQLNSDNLDKANHLQQAKALNDKIKALEDEKQHMRLEIEEKALRLAEIDRLKNMENMVQSQRWGELGQLAESMKKLSTTMVKTASASHDTSLLKFS